MYPLLTLKPGKEIPVRAGHPWIFSEAIANAPKDLEPGSLVDVRDSHGAGVGIGSYHPGTSIAVRIYEKASVALDAGWFAKRLQSVNAWKRPLLPAETTGFRLAHAESDGLPGFIVDLYGDVAVLQIHTAGAERLREPFLEGLTQALHPRAIVERSDVGARKQEGLPVLEPVVRIGTINGPVAFFEASLRFEADVLHGQKTGFFLDQRLARLAVGRLARGKNVVNLFGYSGAFSIHALAGGAKQVTTVDISHEALELAEAHVALNALDPEQTRTEFLQADVLKLLEDDEWRPSVDLLVCDPPAFAKTERHREEALKAYTRVNEQCLKRLPVGGILVTSSCSGRVTPEDFRTMLRIACGRARRRVRVLQWIGHDADHAESLTFPEGRYLKTAILLIES